MIESIEALMAVVRPYGQTKDFPIQTTENDHPCWRELNQNFKRAKRQSFIILDVEYFLCLMECCDFEWFLTSYSPVLNPAKTFWGNVAP
jgi:hypothetical protein